MPAALKDEVTSLRSAGSAVDVILPDQPALSAIGPNPLDPARRPAAAEAGLAQAENAPATLSAAWERLV